MALVDQQDPALMSIVAGPVFDASAISNKLGAVPSDESGSRRPAGIRTLKLYLCHQHVGRTIKIDDIPPPAAARPPGQRRVHQQRIGSVPAYPYIIDRALRCPELRPCALPGVSQLYARFGTRRHRDGDQKHRDRSLRLSSLDTEEFGGAGAIEQHSQIGNIPIGTDQLVLDSDRANDLIQRSVRKVRRLRDWSIVHLRPQRLEALPLSNPPASISRGLSIRPTHVHMDAGDLKGSRAVDRRNAPIPALELRVNGRRHSEDGEQDQEGGNETAAQHSAGLLATTAWKSKRLVSSARSQ